MGKYSDFSFSVVSPRYIQSTLQHFIFPPAIIAWMSEFHYFVFKKSLFLKNTHSPLNQNPKPNV